MQLQIIVISTVQLLFIIYGQVQAYPVVETNFLPFEYINQTSGLKSEFHL
jgi:hypothetical protein